MASGRGGIPVVAIVGRPNVGKSTLFNRFLGQRSAIVEDRARTTRDRLYGDTEWNGRRFVIVDTGGLELDPDDPIEARVQEQAHLAIAEADVILFLVDAMTGTTPADLEAARILRRATAPVIVAVNKADNEKRELEAAEFHALGWEETYAISASHGRGTGIGRRPAGRRARTRLPRGRRHRSGSSSAERAAPCSRSSSSRRARSPRASCIRTSTRDGAGSRSGRRRST